MNNQSALNELNFLLQASLYNDNIEHARVLLLDQWKERHSKSIPVLGLSFSQKQTQELPVKTVAWLVDLKTQYPCVKINLVSMMLEASSYVHQEKLENQIAFFSSFINSLPLLKTDASLFPLKNVSQKSTLMSSCPQSHVRSLLVAQTKFLSDLPTKSVSAVAGLIDQTVSMLRSTSMASADQFLGSLPSRVFREYQKHSTIGGSVVSSEDVAGENILQSVLQNRLSSHPHLKKLMSKCTERDISSWKTHIPALRKKIKSLRKMKDIAEVLERGAKNPVAKKHLIKMSDFAYCASKDQNNLSDKFVGVLLSNFNEKERSLFLKELISINTERCFWYDTKHMPNKLAELLEVLQKFDQHKIKIAHDFPVPSSFVVAMLFDKSSLSNAMVKTKMKMLLPYFPASFAGAIEAIYIANNVACPWPEQGNSFVLKNTPTGGAWNKNEHHIWNNFESVMVKRLLQKSVNTKMQDRPLAVARKM